MNHNDPILVLPFDIELTFSYVVLQLNNIGLHVVRGFEVDSACVSPIHSFCPHTGQSPCGCQVVILQAGDTGNENFPIILHSRGNETEVYLDEAEKAVSPMIGDRIIQALALKLTAHKEEEVLNSD